MRDGRRLIYWDACVFLAYIEGVPGRMAILEALLEQSGRTGDFQSVTSELSRTEVAFAERERSQKTLDPAIEAKIDAMWADKRAIKTIDVHQLLANEARTLMRQGLRNGWSLKPNDAIHLATARWLHTAEFHTYDTRLMKFAAAIGCPIREPAIAQPKLFSETERS